MTDDRIKEIRNKLKETEDEICHFAFNRIMELESDTHLEVSGLDYDIIKETIFTTGGEPYSTRTSHKVRITLQIPNDE